MSDPLVDLTTRAETLERRLREKCDGDSTYRMACYATDDPTKHCVRCLAAPLMRDLLAYASTVRQESKEVDATMVHQLAEAVRRAESAEAALATVSQERDTERAARNMDAEQLCHLMIKLEAAEKERDRQKAAVSINAEQACKLSDKLDAAQSELSALSTRAEQAEQTVWAQAARELHAGSAWVRTAGNIERQDAIDECARILANLARQYEERAATHPQETP